MFRSLGKSWELVKASRDVLMADKELIIFPALSFLGTAIITITFFVPMIFAGMLEGMMEGSVGSFLLMIVMFVFYVVQYFVVFFSNTALVGAALIRLRGGDPTVGDGFRIAFSHFFPVLIYAVIAATVGMILRAISERAGIVGSIVVGILGLAWNLATFLVVPVLVTENVGPFEAIKRSTGYLKKTWGEQIVGNFSIGAVFALAFIGLVIIGLPIMFLALSSGSILLIGGALFVLLMLGIAIGLINSTLSGIFTAALYQYVAEGETATFFSEDLIQGAFRQK